MSSDTGVMLSLRGGIIRDAEETMTENVDAVVRSRSMKIPPFDLLLRHCLAFGETGRPRPPAQVRLEQALGPELARRLVLSLTPAPRR